MAERCDEHKVQVRAYCLMPNHVHLIVVPKFEDGLRRAIGEAQEQIKAFGQHERTGRALGDDVFQKRLEKKLGRVLRRQKPGPKKLG